MRTRQSGIILLACLVLTACGRAAPNAGEEGVLVQHPWVFGHGGVVQEPVKTGLTYTAITTSTIYVNIQPMTVKEHFDDIMSSDGVPLSFDVYLKLQVTSSVKLVQDFGGGYGPVRDEHTGFDVPYWYSANLQGPIRKMIRDEVKRYGLNEIAINYTAEDKVEALEKRVIRNYLVSSNVPVVLLDFNMGKANPPDAIRDQRVKTAAEQQRQITERQTQQAEEARKGAEIARADADKAYRDNLGLSPEQFIQLQQIQMQREVCGKERSNCTFVSPGTSAIVGLP